MADYPYFPFYPADFMSSSRVCLLTLEQQGSYVRLLSLCWMSGDCSLPGDPHKLRTLSGLNEHLFTDVQHLFTPHPIKQGAVTNTRLWKEWEKVLRIAHSRSEAGKKSGKSRRTSVEQVLNKRRTKHEQNRHSQNQNQSHIQNQISEPESQPDKKKITAGSAARSPSEGKSVATWEAYRMAYRERYKVDPVRNQKTNSLLCQLVDKLGAEEAPQVAAFYLTRTKPLYLSSRHAPDLLSRDAEGLRTEWATRMQDSATQPKTMVGLLLS